MPHKMLIVDDEPANLRLLERLFRRDFTVLTASSGAEAMRVLEQHDAALIITDQRMPGMTGIELLKRTADLRPHTVRIILTGYTDVEALVEAINCGQVYKYVTKPWDNDELRLTVGRALEHYETNRARHELALTNARLVSRLHETTRGFVRAIADALEAKDEHILGHAGRVRGYAGAIGRQMGLGAEALERLTLAAFLHDVGKIGTPDRILLKPGSLTPEEQGQMRLHPRRGARMLAGIVGMEEVADAVLHHHEHFDGTGYPAGLRGEQIPMLSRIILVADAYDALTSPRAFREARAHESAVETLREGAGGAFDPEVVRAFCEFEKLTLIRRGVEAGVGTVCPAAPPLTTDPGGLDFDALVGRVEADPVLAARILTEANGIARAPVASLSVACAAVGGARLREVVAEGGERGWCSETSDERREHSLRTAEAAQLLAAQTLILNPEDAYTLGLLHNIGETLLYALFPDEMKLIATFQGEDRAEREVAAFGVDHAQVGQWVLDACGLPRHLTSAVQTHHDVMRTNAPAALLLYLADSIARADDPYTAAALDAVSTERLYMLQLSRNDLFHAHMATESAFERRLSPVI